jgi:CubicO group peptidase (beta-lactamase class C family)
VSRGGTRHWSIGFANVEHQIRFGDGTPQRIASMSKHMAALGLLIALQSAGLTVDATVGAVLADVPAHLARLPIRTLLCCTSGLRNDEGLAWLAGFGVDSVASDAFLHRLLEADTGQNSVPGATFQYCDSGFRIATRMTEALTGEPFEHWSARKLFRPLGMHATRFARDDTVVHLGLATTYLSDSTAGMRRYFGMMSSTGDGACLSTLEDMALWCRAWLRDELPGNVGVAELLELPILADGRRSFYAMGLHTGVHRGLPWFGHSGVYFAYTAFRVVPELDLAVIVLGNRSDIDPRRIAHALIDRVTSEKCSTHLEDAYCAFNGHPGGVPQLRYNPASGHILQWEQRGDVAQVEWYGSRTFLRLETTGHWVAQAGAMSLRADMSQSHEFQVGFGDGGWGRFVAPIPSQVGDADRISGRYINDALGVRLDLQPTAEGLRARIAGGVTAKHEPTLQAVAADVWHGGKVSLRSLEAGRELELHAPGVSRLRYRRAS